MRLISTVLFLVFLLAPSSAIHANEVTYERDLALISQDLSQPINVRAEAIVDLKSFDGPNALIAIGRASRDEHAALRQASIQGARYWSNAAKWDLVSPLLNDTDANVRRDALHTLVAEWKNLPSSFREELHVVLNNYIKSKSDEVDDQLELAWLEQATGDYDSALVRFDNADRVYSDYRIALGMANVYSLKGERLLAIETLSQGIEKYPNVAVLHYQIAMLYHQESDAGNITSHLQSAYELAPNNSQYAYVYALSLRYNNPDRSLQLLDDAYQQGGDPVHLYAKCDLQLSLQRDAKECMTELTKIAPRYAIDQLETQYGVTLL